MLLGRLLLVFNDLKIRVFGRHLLPERRKLLRQIVAMFFPLSGKKTVDPEFAIMQNSFVAENLFPENELVAIERHQIRLAQVVAIGIQAKRNVVLVVNLLFLGVDSDYQCLEILGGLLLFLRSLRREPCLQIRMFLNGSCLLYTSPSPRDRQK